ncbi:hypothetical protein, partial [Caldilinea sp.]|uniref:hypothetical protein n=1 Tax=Caldilinea sp. TaxID=2293560 RepID=UPI002FDD80EF
MQRESKSSLVISSVINYAAFLPHVDGGSAFILDDRRPLSKNVASAERETSNLFWRLAGLADAKQTFVLRCCDGNGAHRRTAAADSSLAKSSSE